MVEPHLLGELPGAVRARLDRRQFAPVPPTVDGFVRRTAAALGVHLVTYRIDHRPSPVGHLCHAILPAVLDDADVETIEALEHRLVTQLARPLAVVAYRRPAVMRSLASPADGRTAPDAPRRHPVIGSPPEIGMYHRG